jgi:hypothetical protein
MRYLPLKLLMKTEGNIFIRNFLFAFPFQKLFQSRRVTIITGLDSAHSTEETEEAFHPQSRLKLEKKRVLHTVHTNNCYLCFDFHSSGDLTHERQHSNEKIDKEMEKNSEMKGNKILKKRFERNHLRSNDYFALSPF